MPASQSDESELLFGRFRVLEVIVDDPLERVLRCWHSKLEKEVMLECGGSGLEAIPTVDGRRRAMREAALLAELGHPGLPRVLDVLEDEHGPVLVLDGYRGETLDARLAREGALAPDEVRRLAIELATTLAAVHAIGAVHRGIATPNVVLRDDGSAFLRGFRFAKNQRDTAGMSSLQYQAPEPEAKQGDVRPQNPAPEQFGGTPACPKTDLFALGCVLYEAAAGVPPWEDLARQGWTTPTALKVGAPALPHDLARVIESCIERAPPRRPQSALAVAKSLDGRPSTARGSRTAAVAAVAAAAAVAGVFVGLRGGEGDDGTAKTRGVGGSNLTATTGSYSPGYAESHALLIGISDYAEFPTLPNARHDVDALQARLELLPRDWDVRVLTGEETTHDGIRTALRDFERALDPEDRGFLYFAGHGERATARGKFGWILPRDAGEDKSERRNWIMFNELELLLDEEMSSKHVLIALDCCYGGLLAQARGAGATVYEERFTTKPAHIAITSGLADQQVPDALKGSDKSPFAMAFIEALSSNRDELTSSALFLSIQDFYTREGVQTMPSSRSSSLNSGGEFVFFLR